MYVSTKGECITFLFLKFEYLADNENSKPRIFGFLE